MVGTRPTKAFAGAILDLARIEPGDRFGRIYHECYPDPLGYGKTKSRFSDPRQRKYHSRFGVVYLGATLKVCFVEALLRDRRNGVVGDYPIEEMELTQRRFAEIVATSPLKLVDLRGDGLVRMGVPSDVVGAATQGLARVWSVAFHEHPMLPDGIIYPSRLNKENNLPIYDRTIPKLRVDRVFSLIEAPGFANVLNSLNVSLA